MRMQKLNFSSKLISIHQHFDPKGAFSHYSETLIQTSGFISHYCQNVEVGFVLALSGTDVFQ